jgi:hypothetical protein
LIKTTGYSFQDPNNLEFVTHHILKLLGNEVDFTAVARGANFSNPNPQQFHQNEFYNGSIDLNPALLNFGSYPPGNLNSLSGEFDWP